MPLGWSFPIPSLNWIRLTVSELGRLKFSIDRQLKVPIFTLTRTTYNDVLRVGVCPVMRPVGVAKKRKKGQKLSCVKLAICPDHPHRRSPLKFCVLGHVQEVLHISSFMKIGRGVSELWGVENRPLPLTRPMAYTTTCTTVQTVI